MSRSDDRDELATEFPAPEPRFLASCWLSRIVQFKASIDVDGDPRSFED